MKITGTLCRHIHKHVSGNSTHSDHTSGMLDRIVRVDQLRTDSAYFRSLAHTEHFCHPVRIDGFDIIVQEEKVLSFCMGCAEIVDS